MNLPLEYVDDIYAQCKAVKQVWFEDPLIPQLEAIPKYSSNIVISRFCRNLPRCNGDLWLNNQGNFFKVWFYHKA